MTELRPEDDLICDARAIRAGRDDAAQDDVRQLWKPVAVLASLAAADALYESNRARKAERENPPVGHFIEVDGVRLHYLDRGGDSWGRAAAVLLHGNGAMAEDFVISGVVDHAARRRRVVSFDRPGFGHSERTRDRLWTPQAQADLLRRALARLGVERPVVVGHSWGTLVALALALEQPQLVAGLVLISGYYYPSARVDAALFAAPAIPVVGDILRYTVSPAIARMMTPAIVREAFSPRPTPERFKAEFPFALTVRPSQIRAAAEDSGFMAPAAAELQPRYPSLQTPVVILAGTDDAIVDMRDHAARLRRDIPRSQLWVEPGVGHMLHYAVPDLVAEAIDSVAARYERVV